MDRLAAIRMFVRVVQSGSFSAVAREAGVGQPAVSKQITALEAHLGAQLLRRTSRSQSLTEAGQDFYESAVRLIDDLEAAESRVGRGQSAPSGLIRVTVAPVFGRLYIVPRLQEFFARYPDIIVECVVTDRTVNLVEEGVDLAIHNGELKDSTLIARKIARTPVITVASPPYLKKHGEPASPSELERHQCIIYAPLGAPRAWSFSGKFGDIDSFPARILNPIRVRMGIPPDSVFSGNALGFSPRIQVSTEGPQHGAQRQEREVQRRAAAEYRVHSACDAKN